MSTQTRKYELKARAESQRETRERIAEAAAELHEEIGVARTTVAEIARRAGVSGSPSTTTSRSWATSSRLLRPLRDPSTRPRTSARLALEDPASACAPCSPTCTAGTARPSR